MEKIDLFPSQLVQRQIFTIDNGILANQILNFESEDPGRKISNYGGYQSNNINFKNFSDELIMLVDEFLSTARALATSYRIKHKIMLGNLWFNVNRTGAFNAPHRHPNSFCSLVYYVSTPEKSGNIVFKNPIQNLYAHIEPEDANLFNTHNSSIWSVVPESGKILAFPSWLEHYVEPNFSQEPRISISANVVIEQTIHSFFESLTKGPKA